MDQRFSCISLWPGLCLILGGAMGWVKRGWIGLLIGAPTGFAAGFLSILLLALTVMLLTKKKKSHQPPVD